MTKIIVVSDEVWSLLRRLKADLNARSYDEVIRLLARDRREVIEKVKDLALQLRDLSDRLMKL